MQQLLFNESPNVEPLTYGYKRRPECLRAKDIQFIKLHTVPARSSIESLEAEISLHWAPAVLDSIIYDPAVYFLCLNKQVIYIGQTHCLVERIYEHMGPRGWKTTRGLFNSNYTKTNPKNNGKAFDATFFIAVGDTWERQWLEARYIELLKPTHNKNQPSFPIGPKPEGLGSCYISE